jgi:hypothetical protein
MSCPFCKLDPYHYEHNGIGYEPVAVVCCDLGCALFGRDKFAAKYARKILRWMQSYSPRAKARAMRALREHGLR